MIKIFLEPVFFASSLNAASWLAYKRDLYDFLISKLFAETRLHLKEANLVECLQYGPLPRLSLVSYVTDEHLQSANRIIISVHFCLIK